MWITLKEEAIKYYITDGFQYHPNMAIFSFNRTLVKVQYPEYKIHLFTENVADFLKEIDEKGSIIIIENRFNKHQEIENNIKDFIELLGHPIQFISIFILKQNKYKKPNTNIINLLTNIYRTNDPSFKGFDISKSILIGANAGRFELTPFYADADDCDRAFAHNIGIGAFRTPEQIFMEIYTTRIWRWKLPHINFFLEKQKALQEPQLKELFSSTETKEEIIFITGSLSSGKTTLARRIADYLKALKKPFKVKDVNFHNRGEICEAIQSNNEMILIVVDVLYDNVVDIYSKLLENKTVRYIEMSCSLETAIFLDRFRLQITPSPKIIAYKKEDIAKWYNTDKKIKTIPFPLILRTRPESFYHY